MKRQLKTHKLRNHYSLYNLCAKSKKTAYNMIWHCTLQVSNLLFPCHCDSAQPLPCEALHTADFRGWAAEGAGEFQWSRQTSRVRQGTCFFWCRGCSNVSCRQAHERISRILEIVKGEKMPSTKTGKKQEPSSFVWMRCTCLWFVCRNMFCVRYHNWFGISRRFLHFLCAPVYFSETIFW